MDPPHLGRVVVQERNNPVLELSVDLNFLVYFALDSRAISLLVPGEERFVAFIHVTANADRAFRDEPLLACFLSADVVEDPILKREEHVGNDLLVSRIVLSLSTRKKEIIPARKKNVQVLLRPEVKPLKTPKLLK